MSQFIKQVLATQEVEETIVPEASLESAELALESATIEVVEAQHELTVAGYAVEELDAAYTSLESIATSLESLMEKDETGLTREAAEGYQHAVRAIVGDAIEMPVASLESFGGDTERTEATQLSLEGIKETLGKIWDGIKRAIAAAVKALSDFIAKMFGGAKKLDTMIDAMIAEAKKVSGKPAEEEVSVGIANAEMLQVKGDFDLKSAKEVIGNVVKGYDGLLGKDASEYTELYKAYIQTMKKDNTDVDAFIKANADYSERIKKKAEAFGNMFMPKGTQIKIEMVADGFQIQFVDVPQYKYDVAKKGAMKAMDAAEVVALLQGAKNIVKAMLDSKKERELIVKTRKEVIKEGDSWVKKVATGKVAEGLSDANANRILRIVSKDQTKALSKADSLAFSAARSVVSIAKAQLANIKEEGKKKEDEK